MIVGFCGSGSMAAAMARGWVGDTPMLFVDSGSGRAAELAAEVGGEAVGSNAEVAARADGVILAFKPARRPASPRRRPHPRLQARRARDRRRGALGRDRRDVAARRDPAGNSRDSL